MRIKKGAYPIKTRHRTTMMSGNMGTLAVYRVDHVTGWHTDKPSDNDPEIYLELADKTAHPVQYYVNMPLSLFVEKFRPESEADIFWTDETARA